MGGGVPAEHTIVDSFDRDVRTRLGYTRFENVTNYANILNLFRKLAGVKNVLVNSASITRSVQIMRDQTHITCVE